jgi:hypothetical protein
MMKTDLTRIKAILTRRFPQNLLFRRPLRGMLLLIVSFFLFAIIYKPIHVHAAQSYSLALTILLYAVFITSPIIGILLVMKHCGCFPRAEKWQLNHELISLLIILVAIGITVYFAGFFIEEPKMRWNLSTFFDSMLRSLLVVFIPLFLPTLINIRYALTPETFQQYLISREDEVPAEDSVQQVSIISKAKREELLFHTHELIYVESQGNYVTFYFDDNRKPNRVVIRNTISDVAAQLAPYPFLMRVHRAFIVNLKQVRSKNGNRLGYRLKVNSCSSEIPVSRNNTSQFDTRMQTMQRSIHQ